jgi:hypothetical protein
VLIVKRFMVSEVHLVFFGWKLKIPKRKKGIEKIEEGKSSESCRIENKSCIRRELEEESSEFETLKQIKGPAESMSRQGFGKGVHEYQ